MPAGIIRILFLCAHPQPFLVAGIRQLKAQFNAAIMVVHWPVPDVSPTGLDVQGVIFIDKSSSDIGSLSIMADEFGPDIIYAAGWMDKDYLKICRKFRKAGKTTVMGMDTQWKGFPKQRLHTVMSPFTLRPIFSYAWVPGPIQHEYARRLGFDDKHILDHLYAPDTDLFKKAYERFLQPKEQSFPKTFLYVGRLVAYKFGPLLKAFSSLSEEERAGWKLMVAGKGPMEHEPEMRSDAIVYKGFLQQDKLVELIGEAGVFCLLSTEEPWGTVIQEFAAAGMPVLASKQCGASHVYVKEGENGYICDGRNTNEIKAVLLKMIGMDAKELLKMGARSMQIASPDNSMVWAKILMSVV